MGQELGALAAWSFADAVSKPPVADRRDQSLADVTRVDRDGRTWVRLVGADAETPVSTVLAAVSVGQRVFVTVRGGRATIVGNSSSPSLGGEAVDERVRPVSRLASQARDMARTASVAAGQAVSDASVAKAAADSATRDAATANDAAGRAVADANVAHVAADEAKASAQEAKADAADAKASATRANTAANDALAQLSLVEDVAGTLDWIQSHGTFVASTDTSVQEGTVYFELSGGDYVPVIPEGDEDPSDEGWYVLDTTESQTDYIMAHLAVTSAGLWVLPSGIGSASTPQQAAGYKMLLASSGAYLYDGSGHLVTTYGESITFDSERPQTIGGENAYIAYYDSDDDGVPDSIYIGGANVTIGGKSASQLLTSLDVSATQTATGADITVNGTTVHLANGAQGPKGDTGTGIASTTVTYGTSASASTEPSSWSQTAPTSIATGTWLWTRTVTVYTDGTDKTSYSKAYVGTNGTNGTSYYTHIRYSASADGTGHVATPTASTLYIGTYTGTSSTAPSSKTSYKWSRYVGQDGTGATVSKTGDTVTITDGSGNAVTVTDGSDGHTPAITTTHSGTTTTIYADGTAVGTVEDGADGSTPSITATKSGGTTTVKVDGTTIATITDGTSVTVSKVEYGTSSSASTQPSSWSQTVPTSITKGRWLWVKTTYSTGDTATTKSYVGTDGEDGKSVYVKSSTKSGDVTTVVLTDGTTDTTLTIADGEDGASGTPGASGYVHTAWANSADGTTDFSTTVSAGKSYLGVYTDNTAADSTSPSAYSWSLIKGEQGIQGPQGPAGTSVTVSSVAYAYQLSTSGTTPPTGTWQATPQAPTTTQFCWTRTIVTFSDGSKATSYAVGGKVGTNGTSPTVTASKTQWQLSTSGTQVPTGTWSDSALAPTTTQYAWTKTTYTYSDGTTATSYAVGGKVGEKGDAGVGLTSITEQWYLSTSDQTPTGGSWSTNQPQWTTGYHIWSRYLVTWDDGTTDTTTPVLASAINSASAAAATAQATADEANAALAGKANMDALTNLQTALNSYSTINDEKWDEAHRTFATVSKLEGYVDNTTYETEIKRLEGSIALGVKKEEIWTDGEGDEVGRWLWDAAIHLTEDSIRSDVSKTYATKDDTEQTRVLSGTIVTADDALAAPPRDLTIYGTSTQDGTPTPEAPVAIESVDELALWVTAGKNLVVDVKDGLFVNGATRKIGISAGAQTAVARVARNTDYVLSYTGGNRCNIAGVDTLDIASGDEARPVFSSTSRVSPKTFNSGENDYIAMFVATSAAPASEIQLELGSTATSYDPHASTTTPINLLGHQLRSLPDGTRDELGVDAAGHVTLVQRIEMVVLDGSSDETWADKSTNTSGMLSHTVVASGIIDGSTLTSGNTVYDNLLCSSFPNGSDNGVNTGSYTCNTVVHIRRTSSQQVVFYKSGESLADFKTWLASNPVTLLYPLATPVIHDLGTVELSTLPSPDVTAWCVDTTELDLEYWRTAGAIAYGQAANLVELSSSVEQQASSITTLLNATGQLSTMIRQYGEGVLVGRVRQGIGALVNANGSFDIVPVTWSDDETPVPTTGDAITTIGADVSRFGEAAGFHIAIETVGAGTENEYRRLAFYDKSGEGGTSALVAYMTGGMLYVENSMVLSTMRIGEDDPTTDADDGWEWVYQSDKNLTLKWRG